MYLILGMAATLVVALAAAALFGHAGLILSIPFGLWAGWVAAGKDIERSRSRRGY